MSKTTKSQYVKRTQKDYSTSFKLGVVNEIEQGLLSKKGAMLKYGIQGDATISNWLKKFGTFDYVNQSQVTMENTPEQKLLELEQKVRMLEKQKASLERQVHESAEKAVIFDMIIDIAEKEFNIPIRKKYLPK